MGRLWNARSNFATARRRGRWTSRVAVVLAMAMVLTMGAPSAVVAQFGPISVHWGWLRDWLTIPAWSQPPTPPTPRQESGTAAGKGHYVDTAATLAGGGAGRPPGTGVGQLPAYSPPSVTAPRVTTGPAGGVFDPATSRRIAAQATATQEVYQNADGSHTRLVHSGPINYKAPDGSYLPIDTHLVNAADGRLHEKANVPSADFAAVGTDPALASVRVDAAHTFAFGLAGAAPVTPTVSGNTARYASVLPDTDLVEQAVAIGMKESIVLRSAAAASSWVFPLRLRGLTAALNRDGGVDLVDAGGAVVGTIPHASMQDANVDPHSGEGAGSEAVTYQLTTVDGGPALRVTADAAWLHDPARVFPVTVDPTANFYATVTDYAQTGNLSDHSGESLIKAGTWDSGTDKATSYLAFSGFATSFAGDKASAVALHIFDVWAYTCTAKPFNVAAVTQSWTTSTVTGFPGPSYGPSIGSATLNPGAACTNTNNDPTVGTWMTVSLPPSTFVDWVSGASPNYGLAVYASYTDSTQWKKFASYNTSNDPYLEVTYSPNVPPQVTGVYPPNNYNATSLTPELLASATDADAFPGAITYTFTIFEASTGTQLATSGAISSSDWVVPAGRLSWAKNYYWTVSTYDGYSYSPTVLSYLNTPVPQPLVTSGLSQSSSGHGFDPSIGDYTTSTTDAQVATVGPELAVHRDYNSRDPRTGGAFGAGWSSLFDARATEVPAGAPQTVVVTYPEGSEVAYGKNADGGYSPPQGRFATFTPVTGGYSLTDKNDTVYRFTQSLGGGAYGITSVTDANGHVETFGYTGSTITTVSSASARALHLTWSTPTGAAWPHVATVATDPVVSGDPASALTWSYSYNADSLTAVCPPSSSTACTAYTYTTGTQYPGAALNAGPRSYWRLGDAAGSATAADAAPAQENSDPAPLSNVTLGVPGGLAGSSATAASFNGTSSYLTLPNGLATGRIYQTLSLWFKTTTPNGVLFSYQKDPISNGSTSASYVPALYVGSDGKLKGEFWPTTQVTTAGAVTDGAWHHVVLAGAGTATMMWLDGTLVGTGSGTIAPPQDYGMNNDYIGVGYIGGSWPDEPHAGATAVPMYFTGSISDVAFYDRPLTTPEVSVLYTTGHRAASPLSGVTRPSGKTYAQIVYSTVTGLVTQVTDNNGGVWRLDPPTVAGSSAAYAGSVLGTAPQDYWRLDDSGAAAVSLVKAPNGTYGTVTLGAAGAFGAGDDAAASFNGTSSYLQLPSNLFPAGNSSQELWFNTTGTNRILLSAQTSAMGSTTCPCLPILWVASDGKLRGLSPSTSPNGPFTAKLLPNKCMDLSGGNTANGTKVQVWTCQNGNANQNWTLYPDGSVRNFGKCLDLNAYGTTNGTRVQLWDCTGASNQVWQPYNGGLRNPVSGRCLDDPGSSTTDGTQFQLYDCNGTNAQLWIQSLVTASAVNDGRWHHAVLSTTGRAQSLYLDGALVQSTTGSFTLTPGTLPYAYLGAGYNGTTTAGLPANTTAYFGGSLDEAAFYTHVLSAADVANHYAAFKSAVGVPPVQTVTVTDPGNRTLSYRYDVLGGNRVLSTTNALGRTTRYGYDSGGFQHTVTDPNGVVTISGHDVRGNTVSTTTCQDQAGNRCSTVYYTYYPNDTSATLTPDPRNDQLLTMRDARSSGATDNTYLSSYGYDAAGNLTSVTSPPVTGFPSGRTTTTAYTDGTTVAAVDTWYAPPGLPRTRTTPGGAVISMRYFHSGDLAEITDPDGQTISYSYDGVGRAVSKTVRYNSRQDGSGTNTTLTMTFEYDKLGQVTRQTDPAVTDRVTGAVHTPVTTTGYDVDGNLTSQTIADSTGGDASRTTTATYNGFDQLASQTDPAGNVITFGYDAYGNRTSVVDPAGDETDYTFDADANLLTTTLRNFTGDPANPSAPADLVLTSHAYDPAGRLASVTDAMGFVTSYTYTDDGMPATVTRSDPARGTSFVNESDSYDAAGNPVSKVTNNGATTTTYTVDAARRTTSATLDPSGVNRTTTYVFSPDDRVTTQTASGSGGSTVTDATYDPAGNVTSRTVHNGVSNLTTSWALDQRGLPTAMTDPRGNTTYDTYDESGRLSVTTAPTVDTEVGGGAPVATRPVTMIGYDTFGEQVEASDPVGNTTTYGYDAAGRLVSTTLPSYTPPGSSTPITAVARKAYDRLGQVVTETDPLGHDTTYTYDQLGRTATVTAPNTGVTHYTYDLNADLLSITDPTGAQTQATYDWLGRKLTATQVVRQPSPAAYTATYAYTAPAGWLTSTTTPDGAVSSLTANAVGETTGVTDGAGNTTTYRYDYAGRKVATVLPDGTSNTVSYDPAGRPVGTAALDASNNTLISTAASFDGTDNLVTATDSRGNTTTFTYDATGLLSSFVQPVASGTTITNSFGYDAAGNRTRYTDGRGNRFLTTYNPWNRPESQIQPATAGYSSPADSTYTTSYDANGEPVTQSAPGGVSVSNSYDTVGNLTSQSGSGAEAPTAARSFGYDLAGRLTSVSAPGGTDTLTRDDRGLLLSASGPSGTSSFGYTADGLLATRTDAAGTASYTYDRADRLGTVSDASTGTLLTYTYNTLSQPSGIAYGSGGDTRDFGYDSQHRLTSDVLKTSAGATIASITYGYDNNANLTSKTTSGYAGSAANTYTYDFANRLTSWNNGTATVNYAYDASGNRTQIGAQTYSYDARDQLISGGGSTFVYTARGTLASVTTGGTTVTSTSDAYGEQITQGPQTYSYDALGRVVNASGAGTYQFAYSGIGTTMAGDGTATYSYGPAGKLTGVKTGGSGVLALTDQHDDLVGELTANAAALSGSRAYDPLGNVIAGTGMAGRLGYQSGWTDPASSRVNMAARWYTPGLGQFTTRDQVAQNPVPNPAAANPFAYVADNPLDGTDPTGHWGFKSIWHSVTNTVSTAYHATVSAVTSAWNYVSSTASSLYDDVLSVGHRIWQAATTVVATVAHQVKQVYHYAQHTVHHVVSHIRHAATAIRHAVVHVAHHAVNVVHRAANVVRHVTAAVHHATAQVSKKVADAYHKTVAKVNAISHAAVKWAENHAELVGMIAGTLAGVVVGGLCTAASFGVGAVGCGIIAGAIGGAISGAVTHGLQVASGQAKGGWGGWLSAVGGGALLGAAGGALGGAIGGKLLGVLGGKMLGGATSLGARVLANAAAGGIAGTITGGAMGALNYGLSCGKRCSWSGAVSAAGQGAITGAVLGTAGGAITGAVGGRPTRSTPLPAHVAAHADVSTAPDTAFFWSGMAERDAGAIAQRMGGTTLEQLAKTRGFDMPEWDPNDPNVAEAWYMISGRYAGKASGVVRAILGPKVRDDTVWNLIELPTLKANPNVTEIIGVDPAAGPEYTIFSRR